MAIPFPFSSFKAAVVVTGVSIVAAAVANLYAPVLSHFVTCSFPVIHDNAVFFLRPPYLYLVINCIIVSIVASSRLQQNLSQVGDPVAAPAPIPVLVSSDVSAYLVADYVPGYIGYVEHNVRDDVSVDRAVDVFQRSPEVITEKKTVIDGGDDRSKMEKLIPRVDSTEFSKPKTEKPLASARFGQRQSIKASSSEDGNKTTALGVSKPRRQDTLETTWRKITEGRSMPLTRHLKKSDTWEKESSHAGSSEQNERGTKSENLDERSSAVGKHRGESQVRLMREASPGQEELNRRVEAFIKKINEEMRLQRQESLTKYQETVNREGLRS